MARSGSLFILHLLHEGVVVHDQQGTLGRALDAYQAPNDYRSLRDELRSAAMALAVTDERFAAHYQSLGRLGIYLIRSHYYLARVERGLIDFDVDSAVSEFGDVELSRLIRLRRVESLSFQDALAIRGRVIDLFDVTMHDQSLEAISVALARRYPQASMLVAQAISNVRVLNYAATPLPPL